MPVLAGLDAQRGSVRQAGADAGAALLPCGGAVPADGGDNGPLSRLLAEGRRDAAAFLLAALREAYPDRLAVELMRHGPTPQQAALEPGLLRLADEAALPIVATNDVYFAEPKTYEAHDALLASPRDGW
jgi:DNA polymerase III alpha subunit